MRSAKFSYKGEEVDLCLCRTKAHFSKEGNTRTLTLDPVDIEFYGLTITVQTRVSFTEGDSSIKITRKIINSTDPNASVDINEYMVGCYGTTEYPEDMTGLTLKLKGADGTEHACKYEYKCREEELAGATCATCDIPAINTRVKMECDKNTATGYYKEGYAFSPMFTLGYKTSLKKGEEVTTWLRLEKEN